MCVSLPCARPGSLQPRGSVGVMETQGTGRVQKGGGVLGGGHLSLSTFRGACWLDLKLFIRLAWVAN